MRRRGALCLAAVGFAKQTAGLRLLLIGAPLLADPPLQSTSSSTLSSWRWTTTSWSARPRRRSTRGSFDRPGAGQNPLKSTAIPAAYRRHPAARRQPFDSGGRRAANDRGRAAIHRRGAARGGGAMGRLRSGVRAGGNEIHLNFLCLDFRRRYENLI